ncbi:universal stress protein [Jiangella mangrovi]|uniref:Nucleotide-binding universal stress UspA family protein n=1 Tax=Jiangella mangrovi TaxID=1524084 RepID=A0A7W9GRL7_9ACTN|nr:universal stress protein [Jiangella mangrovi]MBB5788777.1 nucleotide-binding universal stress UspA family protein [Jiangella mangrovi]
MTTTPIPAEHVAPVNARQIVVGLDGSPSALVALDWAASEARTRGCGLTLVYAHPGDRYSLAVLDTAPQELADDIFDEALDRLATSGFGDLDVRTVLRYGLVPRILLRASMRAPMLVVGRQGLGRFAELVMGSTSLACAAHARVPLTIVPESWEAPARARNCVLLGVDGSARGEAAVEYAFRLAAERGARIVAVHAMQLPLGYPTDRPLRPDTARYEEAAAEVYLTSVNPWLAKFPDVEVTTAVEYGHPALALAQYAAGADLAVIGGRGHGRVTGMLLGSVARSVLRRMPIPVTVIRDPRA